MTKKSGSVVDESLLLMWYTWLLFSFSLPVFLPSLSLFFPWHYGHPCQFFFWGLAVMAVTRDAGLRGVMAIRGGVRCNGGAWL